jgi:ER membrane protein complex subunit 7
MIIVFGMPYLMDNSKFPKSSLRTNRMLTYFAVDPEMRAEFEERQKTSSITSGQAANPLQNFDAASWLAGSSSSTPKRSDTSAERGVTR